MALKVMNGLDLQGQRIVNMGDPSANTDAATKQYVDGLVNGLSWKDSVRAATTAADTLASSFANGSVIDGVTLATGDRILIKNQAAGAENGIYTVNATGAPTRATDADTATEIRQATVYIEEGTTLQDTAWTLTTNAPITLGTTSLTFAQFGAGGTAYSAGNGLQLVSTTFSVLANGTSIDVGASGIKLAAAAGGNGLTVNGTTGVIDIGAGTGITVNADTIQVDTTVVVRKFAASIGTGAATSLAITHNLGTRDITWACYDNTGFADVLVDAVRTDANTLTLTFAVAPATNAYRVVVHA